MLVVRLIDPAFQAAFSKIASPTVLIPAQTAFKFKKMTRQIEEGVKHYNDTRQVILNTYALRREDGEMDSKRDEASGQDLIQLDMTKKEEWEQAFADLHTFEIELGTVSIGSLGDKVDLSVGDMFQLEGVIVE